MRHGKSGNRLSRNQSLRKATLRDLARAILLQERICTTRAKAKEARKLIEKLITLGKKDTLAAKRRAFAILCDHTIVSQLFKTTAPRFKARNGGYTRIIPYIQRSGDNAELAFLELTEKSREIITNLKRSKAVKEAGDIKTVSEAETKPVAPAAGVSAPHSKADVKATTKAAAKPTGVKKLFQRKTGAE
ncbi:MAG: 50S ribosomal protein L17 [Candidatus Omnitrophica bacterium]|nr:50S ribosomal protein L17 [Candidatus Omnitrophota bacterium]